MDQIPNLGDVRQTGFCAFCGCGTETRDHIPPKVFLDRPYPENLQAVVAFRECNQESSMDEEYVACLVACAEAGSVDDDRVERELVRRILRRKPALRARLADALEVTEAGVTCTCETARVRRVILKLARGHAAFDLNDPQLGEPATLAFFELASMPADQRNQFETPPHTDILPEVGSRAMQRTVIAGSVPICDWVHVQAGRYRYLTSVGRATLVRMVIDEYVAGEVTW